MNHVWQPQIYIYRCLQLKTTRLTRSSHSKLTETTNSSNQQVPPTQQKRSMNSTYHIHNNPTFENTHHTETQTPKKKNASSFITCPFWTSNSPSAMQTAISLCIIFCAHNLTSRLSSCLLRSRSRADANIAASASWARNAENWTSLSSSRICSRRSCCSWQCVVSKSST